MSRKPYIKIVYPDASEIAMLLTEAMVRRASGRRVVETESAERESAGQDLFAGSLCCVTETSVELTLNLAPEAMDFALATLIAKNLTQPERDQAMAASDSLELDALFSPCAAEAPGKALDGSSSPDVPSAEQDAATQSGEQEEKIEIGKISDNTLRDILSDMAERLEHEDAIEVIEETIKEIDYKEGVIEEDPVLIQEDTVLLDMLSVLICGAIRVNNKRITELKTYASNVAHYLNAAHPDDKNVFTVAAHDLADALFSVQHDFTEDANRTLDAEMLVRKNKRIDDSREKLTWEDVEKEVRKIGQSKPRTKKSAAPLADGDGEIEPGLLNDLDDGSDGMAPAEEVMGHDE